MKDTESPSGRFPSDGEAMREAGRLAGLREAVQILLDTEEAGRTAKLEIMRRIVVANMPASPRPDAKPEAGGLP